MKRLLCKILGHRWLLLWAAPTRGRGGDSLVCVRCHENGWQV